MTCPMASSTSTGVCQPREATAAAGQSRTRAVTRVPGRRQIVRPPEGWALCRHRPVQRLHPAWTRHRPRSMTKVFGEATSVPQGDPGHHSDPPLRRSRTRARLSQRGSSPAESVPAPSTRPARIGQNGQGPTSGASGARLLGASPNQERRAPTPTRRPTVRQPPATRQVGHRRAATDRREGDVPAHRAPSPKRKDRRSPRPRWRSPRRLPCPSCPPGCCSLGRHDGPSDGKRRDMALSPAMARWTRTGGEKTARAWVTRRAAMGVEPRERC